MTAVLVSLTELKRFVPSTPAGDDTLLQEILDEVEDKLLRDAGRTDRPFSAAQTSFTEVHDGTGSDTLYLNYPISAITVISLGRDTTDYDETLDPADVDDVIYVAGKRKIVRTDGGVWRAATEPRCVRVTYSAQADTPESPQLAIKRLCATVYRQRGAEDATSETVGGFYTRQLVEAGAGDPLWNQAVAALWEPFR